MIWLILHIVDWAVWFIILGSVVYVAFFAIISLFYDKEDQFATQAAASIFTHHPINTHI